MMAERAAGDARVQGQRRSSPEQQEEQCRLLGYCNPLDKEGGRIQDCTKDTPTMTISTSSSGSSSICYHPDHHQHLKSDSGLGSIGCSIQSSSTSSTSSSRSITPPDIATACRSEIPVVDLSTFGFSGSGSGGDCCNSGSSTYPETEPPSSDTSNSYGFPRECVAPGLAVRATVEASKGFPLATPAGGGYVIPELRDGGGKHPRGSPSNEALPAGPSKIERIPAKAQTSAAGHCCDSRSPCESSDKTVARKVAGGIGASFSASPLAISASALTGEWREELDDSGADDGGTTGGTTGRGRMPTGGDRQPRRFWQSSSSKRAASTAPASAASDASVAITCACRVALTSFGLLGHQELDRACSPVVSTGGDGRYHSAADHVVNREDGRNHKNDTRRIGDVEALGRGARLPVSMRIPRYGGFGDSAEHPEVSTAKRARCTRLPRNDEPWDGPERGGREGLVSQKNSESSNGNGNGKIIENTSNYCRNIEKHSGTSSFEGMDVGSFPALQTPPMLRTAKKQSWASSTSCCTGGSGGGAAGGNPALRSGYPSDMSDLMKSFRNIKLSSHSELPSGTSRGRVLLRTRAVRSIQSFPDVTCFRDCAAMHEEDQDGAWRGRSLSDSVVPMDETCSGGRCDDDKEGRGGGGLRGRGHRRVIGHNHCGSGGDSINGLVVGVKGAVWPGASHEEGKSVTGGEEFERWIRSNSSNSSTSACSICSVDTSADVVEVWKEKGGRRAPRPVTQTTRTESIPQSRKHRLI